MNIAKNMLVLIFGFIFITTISISQLQIPYTHVSPIIDGEISDGEWSSAERAYLDIETHPSQNIPALVDTEVFMMEDGLNFYVAFIALDPEPAGPEPSREAS